VKRYGDLWPSVVSWPNLLLAARKARHGKRGCAVVQRFEFDQERQLLRLQRELEGGSYRPGPFTTHWIARPKRRLISAAPYRDRVVHHAVMNVLEPLLDRHFHPDSYACRRGKGTHAASRRLQQFMRRCRFTLQCDVCRFFPSIDHAVLKERFRRRFKDRRLLGLLDRIVDGSNGRLCRLRKVLARGEVSRVEVHQRLLSWLGHAGQADSRMLLRRLGQGWCFRRGQFHAFR
jgi:hypothetical protein